MSKMHSKLIVMLALILALAFSSAAQENETDPDTIEPETIEWESPEEGVENSPEDTIIQGDNVNSSNEVTTPNPCGNQIIDEGENCLSCPSDVRCKSGEMCNLETGSCESRGSSFMLYGMIALVIVAIAAFIIFKSVMRKKKAEEEKLQAEKARTSPLQQTAVNSVAAKAPVAGQIQQNAAKQSANSIQSQQSQSSQEAQIMQAISGASGTASPGKQAMPSEKQGQAPQQAKKQADPLQPSTDSGQQEAEAFKPQMPPQKGSFGQVGKAGKKQASASSPIKDYILQMRATGIADEEIRNKLRQKGWPDFRIAIEFVELGKKGKKQ